MVCISENVVSIGGWAFENCTALGTVYFPNKLEVIEGSAFSGCISLNDISLPNGLKEIGGSAFYGCVGLTRIELPNSVHTIGGSAFAECIKFVVKFDNYDSVGKVYIASTRSGITNKMQANPTSIPGEFVAEGFFEDAETSYIPGTINVLYSTKGAVEDYTSDLTSDQIPDGWKNATTEVITNTSTEYKATSLCLMKIKLN